MKDFLKREGVLLFASIFFGLFFVILNFIYYSPIEHHTHDSIAWILAGVAPILKIGVAYKDYWDRMPPGLALLTFTWAKIFGYQDLSFQILHLVTLLALIPLFYLVFKKIDNSFLILPAITSSFLISFAPVFMSYRLTSEQLGLLFSLLGLVLLLYKKNNLLFVCLGALFLFFASQMKDPFGPSIISLVPVFIYYYVVKKDIIKIALSSLLGVLIGTLTIAFYLFYLGNFKAYFEILKYKSSVFDIFDLYQLITRLYSFFVIIIDRLFLFKILIFLVPFIVLALLLIEKIFIKKELVFKITPLSLQIVNRTKKTFNIDRVTNFSIIIFFVAGNYLGFCLQGSPNEHQIIQIVVPIILLFSFVIPFTFQTISSIIHEKIHSSKLTLLFTKIILFIFITLITFPYIDIAHSYGIKFASQKLSHFALVQKSEDNIFEFINKQTKPDDCILRYYGWAVDQTYYYSQRKPCTKFIKPALIMQYPQYFKEIKNELKKNPPALIYYTPFGADMNVEKFETEVINLGELIKTCYQKTEYTDVYLPKDKDKKEFRQCYNFFFE